VILTIFKPKMWIRKETYRKLHNGQGHDLLILVNWHEVMDERSYQMDQVIVAILRGEPSKLDQVKAWIERFLADPDYSQHSKDDLREWLDIIQSRGLNGVIAILQDQGEKSARMRQNSPFAVLMPEEDRLRILRQYETRRPRTRLASF
jgi:hypothetical protein